MTRLILKYAIEGLGTELVFTVGKNADDVTRAEGGGWWLKIGRVLRWVPDAHVQSMQREEPEPPDSKCKYCQKPFANSHALRVHIGRSHSEQRL